MVVVQHRRHLRSNPVPVWERRTVLKSQSDVSIDSRSSTHGEVERVQCTRSDPREISDVPISDTNDHTSDTEVLSSS